MDQRFVEGDRGTKVRFLGLLVVNGLVIWGAAPFFDLINPLHQPIGAGDPVQTLKHLGGKVLFVASASAAVLGAWSVYLFRMALAAKRADRWPPPGMRVPFRVGIRDGRYSMHLGVASATIAVLSILLAVIGVYGWYVLSRSTVELMSPNQHIQLTPKSGAADVRRWADRRSGPMMNVKGDDVVLDLGRAGDCVEGWP